MEIFVGIDPSMNSTGICMMFYENGEKIKEKFFIIKPNKLTRGEKKAQEDLLDFDYILYEAEDLKGYNENNHLHEYHKTCNMCKLVSLIAEVVTGPPVRGMLDNNEIYVVIEGISYGSTLRTRSVFDLAGLNYMIRQRLINARNVHFNICPPTEIKKFTTGNGNCPKEAMIELFKRGHEKYMILKKIDDIADAYFMAEYSKKLYDDENEKEG